MNWQQTCACALAIILPSVALTSEPSRPPLVVGDTGSGCPSVEGMFVALLDPDRGMLLLSGAAFPGGHVAGEATGGPLGVPMPDGGQWWLESAGSSAGPVNLWAARYPFLATRGSGCVGFDRERWSSEGDLVTYMRWLVEDVYLALPSEERSRRADLRLADREIAIMISRERFGDLELRGKEGATLASRYDDSGRLYLFMPFVLDEPAGRIAVKVMSTEGTYFDREAKTTIGWAVASPGQPGALAGTDFTIAAVEIIDGR
jgi:hypothetical protein